MIRSHSLMNATEDLFNAGKTYIKINMKMLIVLAKLAIYNFLLCLQKRYFT